MHVCVWVNKFTRPSNYQCTYTIIILDLESSKDTNHAGKLQPLASTVHCMSMLTTKTQTDTPLTKHLITESDYITGLLEIHVKL